MHTLVVNAGSSSVKFQLFDDEQSLISGMCEEIGTERAKLKYTFGETKEKKPHAMADHKEALETAMALLDEKGFSLNKITIVAHRTVHGGEYFKGATLIDADVVKKLKELIPLAPLHNPPNIICIELMQALIPQAKHVAIFDTAYHSTLPEKAYLYGIPYTYYQKYHIRKYGFHGSSHKFVVGETLKKLGDFQARVISFHMGNGVSLCATKAGQSQDTSMGFTPMQGSIMGTRCGLIDPSIVPFLMREEQLDHIAVDRVLNKESGFLGLSGISSDHRVIEEEMAKGNIAAKRAHDVFCYRLTKLAGGYVAALNGIDAFVFTGGIGEHSSQARKDILRQFSYVGVELDEEANNKDAFEITAPTSKVKAYVIPTNEELQMVRDAKALLTATS